jgi:hypothetical protein
MPTRWSIHHSADKGPYNDRRQGAKEAPSPTQYDPV